MRQHEHIHLIKVLDFRRQQIPMLVTDLLRSSLQVHVSPPIHRWTPKSAFKTFVRLGRHRSRNRGENNHAAHHRNSDSSPHISILIFPRLPALKTRYRNYPDLPPLSMNPTRTARRT